MKCRGACPPSWLQAAVLFLHLVASGSFAPTTTTSCMNRYLSMTMNSRDDGPVDHHRLFPKDVFTILQDDRDKIPTPQSPEISEIPKLSGKSLLDTLVSKIQSQIQLPSKLPPAKIEDSNVLFYDIILIINLTVSISFFVVHRLDLDWVGLAFNEGCLLSLMWIGSGLYSGAFLHSAKDGHTANGGPQAAAMLGLQTFLNAINLRLLFALMIAFLQHRPVGAATGEQIMVYEIGFGLLLMSLWRALHSAFVQRY